MSWIITFLKICFIFVFFSSSTEMMALIVRGPVWWSLPVQTLCAGEKQTQTSVTTGELYIRTGKL